MKKKIKSGAESLKTKIYKNPATTLPMYEHKCNPKHIHKWIPRVNNPVVCPHCHRSL